MTIPKRSRHELVYARTFASKVYGRGSHEAGESEAIEVTEATRVRCCKSVNNSSHSTVFPIFSGAIRGMQA